MSVLSARSDLKFINQFARVVSKYVAAFDELEALVRNGTMTGPNSYGGMAPETLQRMQETEREFHETRADLNAMLKRAGRISRARGVHASYSDLLATPGSYRKILWEGSALSQEDRIRMMDALSQTIPECEQHLKSEFRNLFNPFHHMANLIRLILYPLAVLFGKHFELFVKMITPAVTLVLIILILKYFGLKVEGLKDIVPFIKH